MTLQPQCQPWWVCDNTPKSQKGWYSSYRKSLPCMLHFSQESFSRHNTHKNPGHCFLQLDTASMSAKGAELAGCQSVEFCSVVLVTLCHSLYTEKNHRDVNVENTGCNQQTRHLLLSSIIQAVPHPEKPFWWVGYANVLTHLIITHFALPATQTCTQTPEIPGPQVTARGICVISIQIWEHMEKSWVL